MGDGAKNMNIADRQNMDGEDRDTEEEAIHIEDYVRDCGLRLRRRAVAGAGASGCHWAR